MPFHGTQLLLHDTEEVLRADLRRQVLHSPGFVQRYFPTMMAESRVAAFDFSTLTRDQADALAFSLTRSVRVFLDKAREARTGVTSSADSPEISWDVADRYEERARQYRSALRDLCSAFGLTCFF